MVRAADRTQEAVLQALATGSFYATNGPEIHDVRRDGGAIEVRCSPAATVILRSGFERGLSVESGPRARLERSHILERDGSGAIVRARFDPEPDDLTYARIQVSDERGRSAWTNPI